MSHYDALSHPSTVKYYYIRQYAEELHIAISNQDEKHFEDVLERAEKNYGLFILEAIINYNFMDQQNNIFTAVQAATVHAIQTKDSSYLSRLIQLGGEVTWDTSPLDDSLTRYHQKQALDYVYQGNAMSGDSIYEAFVRAGDQLESYLFRAHNEILDETLSSIKTLPLLPRDIIAIINQYVGLQIQIIFSLSDNQPRTWLSDFTDQEIFYAYRNGYNQQNPDAEKNGYGAGALVVYQPKPHN